MNPKPSSRRNTSSASRPGTPLGPLPARPSLPDWRFEPKEKDNPENYQPPPDSDGNSEESEDDGDDETSQKDNNLQLEEEEMIF